jgi:hypothetical protein
MFGDITIESCEFIDVKNDVSFSIIVLYQWALYYVNSADINAYNTALLPWQLLMCNRGSLQEFRT